MEAFTSWFSNATNSIAEGETSGISPQPLIDAYNPYSEQNKEKDEGEDEGGWSCMPKCSWEQRVMGYGVCWILSLLCGLLGSIALWVGGEAGSFALVYGIGELFLLAGTMFLASPQKQCQRMFKSWDHITASCIWLASIVVIFIVAFTVANDDDNPGIIVLIMILVLVEKAAYIWYCLAFWPGGHTAAWLMVKTLCTSCFGGS